MGFALKDERTYDVTSCAQCGIVFYVDSWWLGARKNSKETFYCPNGHSLSYSEGEVDRLKRELAAKDNQLQFQRSRADNLDKRLQQETKKATRLRTRASNGVCPCCNRSFEALARHMKNKHPDYKPA